MRVKAEIKGKVIDKGRTKKGKEYITIKNENNKYIKVYGQDIYYEVGEEIEEEITTFVDDNSFFFIE